MAKAIGQQTLAGFKLETTSGTAIAVGAGNQREFKVGSSLSPPAEKERNDDALIPAPTQNWPVEKMGAVSVPMDFRYLGHELELGIMMGALAIPDQQTNIRAYVGNAYFSALVESMTTAIGKGQGKSASSDVMEVAELAGTRIKSWTLSQDQGRLKQVFEVVAKEPSYNTTAGTNTTSTIILLTMPDAAYPTNLARFTHLSAWMAHQDQDSFGAADEICIEGFELKVDFGISDDIGDHRCTTGTTVPEVTEDRKVELTLKFLRDNAATKSFVDMIRTYELMKVMLFHDSDKGIPGNSVSGSSPSVDITGAGVDPDLIIGFTLTLPNGSTVSESQNIVLTNAGKNSGILIAAEIESKIQTATATDKRFQKLYDNFHCDFTTVAGQYWSTVNTSDLVAITFTAGTGNDVTASLKLAPGDGAVDVTHVKYGLKLPFPEVDFSPPGDDYEKGQMKVEIAGRCGIGYATTTPYGFNTAEDAEILTIGAITGMESEEFRVITRNRLAAAPF